MSEQHDELLAEVDLGDQADQFLQGDLGRYLFGCCDQEVEAAVRDLKVVDASNTKAIQDLQNRIWRAESVKAWLVELVLRGQQAIGVIQGEQTE